MRSTAATRLPTEDSGLGSPERSANELLGTDQPRLDRQNNRPMTEKNFVGDSGSRRTY